MVFRSIISGVVVLCTTVLVLMAVTLSNNTANADPTECICGIFGDLNCDGQINPVDIVYIVNLVYKDNDARCVPDILDCPILLGDVNCDGEINPIDVIYYARVIYGNQDAFCANPCPPTGEFIDMVDCDPYTDEPPAPGTSSAPDCIEYFYDGQSTLMLRHINACSNCCPAIMDLQVSVTSGLITVEEGGWGYCHCLCLYEFEYQIDNLPPGTYTIYVIGNCHDDEPEEHLRITVNLVDSPTGTYCIDRDEMPWNWY